MPGIRKVSLFGKISKDDIDYDNDNDHLQYCQNCFNAGFKSVLKRRVYRVENQMLIREVPPIPDADKWRQCYRCGDIVPIYNVKQESSLIDFVDPVTNPFDDNKDKMDKLERTDRLKKNKSKYARKRAQINSIKDDDIRRELEDGQSQLTSYKEL